MTIKRNSKFMLIKLHKGRTVYGNEIVKIIVTLLIKHLFDVCFYTFL